MRILGCFLAAAAVHALLLFGFRMGTPARRLDMSDEPAPMDVSLVEAAPERPAAAPTPEAPAPTPAPPEPQPAPDMPAPPPTPAPAAESTPAPERPNPAGQRPREKTHASPHSAPGTADSLAGAKGRGAAAGPVSERARYLSNPRPDYPEEARQMRQQGVVLLSVDVGADGRADAVSVSHSSGFPQLDAAAARAVRQWIFAPARAGGLPVASRVDVPVRFSLSD